MRVLVTGASGFIGRHCVQALIEQGREVHAVTYDQPVRGTKGIVWHQADLEQPHQVARLLVRSAPTHVIHSAWSVTPGAYWTSPDNLTWAMHSAGLLHEARRHGVRRIVGIGTCAEYGHNHRICDERTTAVCPVGAYAQTKLATQLLFDSVNATPELSTAWARLFFPYGPFDRPTKVIPYTISRLLKGEPADLSNGEQVRDFLFAPDIARAIVAVLESNVCGPVNVASGEGVAVRDVLLKIGEMLGRPELIRLGARPIHSLEATRWVAAVDRLHNEVGWRQTVSLEEGLRATVAALGKPA